MRFLSSAVLLAWALTSMTMPCRLRAQSTDAAAIQRILDAQAAAWNRGDASGWAAYFTDDADFVNIRGDVFHGREAITSQHARIFAGAFHGSHVTITERQLTEPVTGMALVETDQVVTLFKGLPPGVIPTSEGTLHTRMKYVAVEHGGEWRFVAAQNTAVLPAPPHP